MSVSVLAGPAVHFEFENNLSDSTGSQGSAMAVGNVGYSSNSMEVAVGGAVLTLDGAGSTYVTFDQQINLAQDLLMHHYALVADGAGKLDLYRDGSFDESVTVVDTSFDIDSVGRADNNSVYDFVNQLILLSNISYGTLILFQ